MKITAKTVYLMDVFVLVGSAIAVLWLIGYVQPLLIAPTDELVTSNTSILFSFEKGNVIYIDDNPLFTSPEKIYVEDNLVVNLKPGVYYWKVEGVASSEIRTLTINSYVDLRLRENGERVDVLNAGNVPLNVTIYNNQTIVGSIILNVDESGNSSANVTRIEGGQNGE